MWCLSHGITIVFMHLYYFPIILLAYRYRRRGVYLSALLALSYLGLVLFYNPSNPVPVTEALVRVIVFLGIAALVAYFSARLVRVQRETQRSADILESSLMNANVLLVLLDARGKVLIWNKAAERITGFPAAEVIGGNGIWKLLYPEKEYRNSITGRITRIVGEDNFFENLETTIRCRDGGRKDISWNTRAIPGTDGSGNRYIAIGIDVTESRRAANALRESEERFRAIFDHASDGIFLVDLEQQRYVACNDTCARMIGYGSDEFPSLRIADIHPPEDLPFIYREIAKLAKGGEGQRSDIRFRRKDGSVFFTDLSAVLVTIAGSRYLLVSFRDITERRQAEKALQESEEKYRNLVDRANDGIAIVQDAAIRFANPGLARVWGGTVDEMTGLRLDALFPQEEREKLLDLYRKRLAGEEVPSIYETPLLRRDGSRFPAEINVGVISFGGRPAVLAIVRDIAARKQAEAAIRESEARYRSLFENMLDGYAYCRMISEEGRPADFVYLDVNPAFGRLTGLKDVVGRRVTSVIPGIRESNPELFEIYGKVAGTGVPERFETFIPGLGIWLSIAVFSPGREHFVAVFDNVTDRKRAEAALRESEEKFRKIFNSANDAIEIMEMREDGSPGLLLEVNEVACSALQYTREEMLGMSPLTYTTESSSRPFPQIFGELLAGGHAVFETGHRRKDGTTFPVEINAHVITLIGRKVILSVVRNITERKQMEAALRESEEMFRNPVERSSVGIFLVQDGTVKYANPRLAEMAGYFGESFTGMPFEPMILPEDLPKVREAMGRLTRGETLSEHLEFRAIEKDGAVREVEAYGSSMVFHGRPAIFGTIIDITDRKRMEAQITASLREKEVMLREIHHRVKNNLQIVNSLMNLQMQKVGDPTTVMALTDTQARVRAMSLVHERLYKTQELSRIDLHDYLTKLVEELIRSQKVAQKIELDFRIEGVFLDINQAIPVGLILNEILTNSLKYAFPDGRNGKISISADREGEGLTIRIGDDGVGIPAGFDWQKSNTLGMRLIHGLVSQVDGTIALERDGGTRYVIRIPDHKPVAEGEKR
ncbi:MAG TPA: PAS domain S-box protein [Methanomicrobiales archaeon]|nr:PAS domain S-box protein [Methanomicrobiales archaeon]